ncbi:MAG TPA: metal-dependent hydrolase [Steroidobacteraceae bacterium]|nr:metal-dependent hydrolase [Steroidobacteraceae bacterium]
MDNVTHTLVGALLGEAIARCCLRSLPLEARRRLFVPTLAIGSNLPDLDLLYTTVGQGKLDYLLHHRGHTHTILGALLLSLGMGLLYEWLWRRRKVVPLPLERRALWVAVLLGPLLHIAMDATNSYGVHPYWPFDNRWRYGDAVFIIEPLFWAASAPLVFLLRSTCARGLVVLALVAGIWLGLGTQMVPWPLLGAFIVLSAVMLYVGYKLSPPRAAVTGVIVWLAFTAMFLSAGATAEARLHAALRRAMPTEPLLDAMRSPMPMNPVCWEVMLVQSRDAASFSVRRAVLSLAPDWIPASTCPTRGLNLPTSAPLRAVSVPDNGELQWHGELIMSRIALRQLARQRCEAHALLQFARIPWLSESAQVVRLGDLRYDREPAPGFAEIDIEEGSPQRCPRWGVPWIEPRRDLLESVPAR